MKMEQNFFQFFQLNFQMSWLLVYFAGTKVVPGTFVYHLYAARILNGIVGGGLFVMIPLFLSEIASDR